MTTILALDPEVGWAFAQENDRILLLRPPYRNIQQARVVPESVVERAVTHHGYRGCSQQCESLADAIEWIRAQVLDHRKAIGRPIPAARTLGTSLLKTAPAPMIEHVLQRIADEFLPAGDLSAAEELLAFLRSESEAVRNTQTLWDKTTQLWQTLCERKHEQNEKEKSLVGEENRFRTLRKCGLDRRALELEQNTRRDQSLWRLTA